jgi:hypothetical protein
MPSNKGINSSANKSLKYIEQHCLSLFLEEHSSIYEKKARTEGIKKKKLG